MDEQTKDNMAQTGALSYKVLIVDDDKFLVNMYTIKFKKIGSEVVSATGGQEALNKLRAGFSPDAVIIDIIMPGIDGFELLEKIRADKLAGNAVIVFLTNQGQSPDIDKAKNLGVDGYIVKASTIPSEVVARISELVNAKRGVKNSI